MIGRIVRPADFERVLATVPRSRSAHFAVHHVCGEPSRGRAAQQPRRAGAVVPPVSPDLSTGAPDSGQALVDESSRPGAEAGAHGHWLGLVVPKRHAKRAVTRNLIKRQLRAAMARHAGRLPPGLWVVRLRLGFDRQAFPSPASDPLRETAHDEIELLFSRAANPPPPRSR